MPFMSARLGRILLYLDLLSSCTTALLMLICIIYSLPNVRRKGEQEECDSHVPVRHAPLRHGYISVTFWILTLCTFYFYLSQPLVFSFGSFGCTLYKIPLCWTTYSPISYIISRPLWRTTKVRRLQRSTFLPIPRPKERRCRRKCSRLIRLGERKIRTTLPH